MAHIYPIAIESLLDMTFDHLEEVKLGNFIGRMNFLTQDYNSSLRSQIFRVHHLKKKLST
ncbi:hypothetical protein H5410_006339 [Solanum commersonii]|uniref:Uncharacterized protein n=1 Tax=Solanum commersonii TaxID=4109 RepID=A0A9J6A9F9_SOLCO|nr:hypothetical protein H5410_006339 [Solanum commersonii]